MQTSSLKEDHISQTRALQLQVNMGYKYLSPEEAYKERGEKLSNVLFEHILEEQLRKMNKIRYKGKEYDFSDNNITHAVLFPVRNFHANLQYVNYNIFY